MSFSPEGLTLAELTAAIRKKSVAPSELLEHYIARIEKVNPALNAVAERRYELARREAVAADHKLAAARSGDALPPLFGVPCTIKEFFAIRGMRQTGGLLAARDYVADHDATVVARLREAGAIIMATTNVPEGGMWMETHNLIYGRTNNPWNVAHTPGGSSGGEAALVAAGASPFGIGSDIGGSVRIPAAFCGVSAHKPSGRLVPNTGHWGPKDHETGPFLTAGPICPSAHDLGVLLPIMAGPDGEDPHTEAWALGDPSEVDLSELTVYELEGFGTFPYDAESLRARDRAIEVLVARGARRETLRVEGLASPFAVWARAMEDAAEGSDDGSFGAVITGGGKVSVMAEILRALIGRQRYTAPALGLLALEKIAALVPKSLSEKIPRAAALAVTVNATLGGRGVIIHPTYTRAAPRHHASLWTPFHGMSTAVWNVLELPASQVPTGFAATGLPLGVQIIGSRGNDHVTIAAAQAIEDDLGRLGAAPLV